MEVKKSKKASLQNKKLLFLEIGMVLALAVILFAFEWSTKDAAVTMFEDNRSVVAEEEMIAIQPDQPPPPPEAPRAPVMTDEFIVVDDDVKIEMDIIVSSEETHTEVEIMDYVEGRGEEAVEEDIPFAIVEDKPTFQGGDENQFSKWINSKVVYPQSAVENGVQGRVWVKFTVSTSGAVENVSVIRGIDSALDKEALRVVSSSPKWVPGKQRGKPVRVVYQIPVTFQLR